MRLKLLVYGFSYSKGLSGSVIKKFCLIVATFDDLL